MPDSPKHAEHERLATQYETPLEHVNILRGKFDALDEDHSGDLDKADFLVIIKDLLGADAEKEFDSHWKVADHDDTGEIQFEEFIVWYNTLSADQKSKAVK